MARDVGQIWETRNECKVLVGKPVGKRPLGTSKRSQKDNIKTDRQKIYSLGWEVDGIDSSSRPVLGFGICGVESSSSSTRDLDYVYKTPEHF